MNGGFLGFEILRPWLSGLLLAVPAVLAVSLLTRGARLRARRKLVDARHDERFMPERSAGRFALRLGLATAAVFFMASSLLGPVRGFTLREVRRKGVDLVVCIDTSRSMLVEDKKPNRLERAKNQVRLLLERLEGDRVALLAFAGDVRSEAPLTRDRETLKWFLGTISVADNVVGGTHLGGALSAALERFDGRTGAHEAIVLLTDGEDLGGQGLELAEEAAQRGIGVYVIGMGTAVGGKIPDGHGGFVRDENGQEVVSALDGATLRSIAGITGGAYLSVEDHPIPIEEIYDRRISRLEGRTLEDGMERIPHDRYQWPLCLALVCMLIETLVRERRRTRRGEVAA